MKKIITGTTIILLLVAALSSCMTSSATTFTLRPGEYSEEEASYALQTALNQAVDSTNTRFKQKLETYSFIPDVYRSIVINQDQIPGMKKLIEQWNNYVSKYIEERYEIIEQSTTECASLLTFEDAMEMVTSSNKSASILLEKEFGNDFKEILSSLLSDLDYTIMENAINQYNAWIEAQNYINKTDNQKLQTVDISQDIMEIAYDNYKTTVEMFEELFRTTPSPYSDEICKNVFGIK